MLRNLVLVRTLDKMYLERLTRILVSKFGYGYVMNFKFLFQKNRSKKKLKKLLFDILKNEDSYLDVKNI